MREKARVGVVVRFFVSVMARICGPNQPMIRAGKTLAPLYPYTAIHAHDPLWLYLLLWCLIMSPLLCLCCHSLICTYIYMFV